jgi:hypothetical protein
MFVGLSRSHCLVLCNQNRSTLPRSGLLQASYVHLQNLLPADAHEGVTLMAYLVCSLLCLAGSWWDVFQWSCFHPGLGHYRHILDDHTSAGVNPASRAVSRSFARGGAMSGKGCPDHKCIRHYVVKTVHQGHAVGNKC